MFSKKLSRINFFAILDVFDMGSLVLSKGSEDEEIECIFECWKWTEEPNY